MIDNGAIAIGEVRAEKGQIARGYLPIGETATGPVAIPIVIINGKAEGPTLCLTAGVHATEYAPIETVFRLIHESGPANITRCRCCGSYCEHAYVRGAQRFCFADRWPEPE